LASILRKLRENNEFQKLQLKVFESEFGKTTKNGQIWLTVFGSRNWNLNPISMVRQYTMSRSELPEVLLIMSDTQNIMDKKES